MSGTKKEEVSKKLFIDPNIKIDDKGLDDKELVIKALSEEISRRDRIIDELKKENTLLLKVSLKRSESLEELKKQMNEKR